VCSSDLDAMITLYIYILYRITTSSKQQATRTTMTTTPLPSADCYTTLPTAPRDVDELEGTLLLPTATPVESGVANAVLVPWEYPDNDTTEEFHNATTTTDTAPPTAPLIPEYDDWKKKEHEAKAKRARGMQLGLIKAEEERVALAKGHRDVFAKQYHAKKHVEKANMLARHIDTTRGVEIEKDNWMGKEDLVAVAAPKEKEEYSFSTISSGGYEVAEYKGYEYTPRAEYETTEYKSVYDSVS